VWTANFEDGTSVNSKQKFWTQLPRDKKLSGLQLSHPLIPKMYLCLSGYDLYHFVQEAIAFLENPAPNVVAEIIGAHDCKLGVVVEVRLEYTGNVKITTYPVSKFKYSPEILYEGKTVEGRTPRPSVSVAPAESAA